MVSSKVVPWAASTVEMSAAMKVSSKVVPWAVSTVEMSAALMALYLVDQKAA